MRDSEVERALGLGSLAKVQSQFQERHQSCLVEVAQIGACMCKFLSYAQETVCRHKETHFFCTFILPLQKIRSKQPQGSWRPELAGEVCLDSFWLGSDL